MLSPLRCPESPSPLHRSLSLQDWPQTLACPERRLPEPGFSPGGRAAAHEGKEEGGQQTGVAVLADSPVSASEPRKQHRSPVVGTVKQTGGAAVMSGLPAHPGESGNWICLVRVHAAQHDEALLAGPEEDSPSSGNPYSQRLLALPQAQAAWLKGQCHQAPDPGIRLSSTPHIQPVSRSCWGLFPGYNPNLSTSPLRALRPPWP